MPRLKNDKLIEAVVSEMPKEYANQMSHIETQPLVMNSFINTLTNKVAKSIVFSKIYNNHLRELKKGELDLGYSIEEIFVQMAQARGFGANWEENAPTAEADLIRKLTPVVTALYLTVNVDYKSKTSVTHKDLKKAFTNPYGLSNLIDSIVGSLTSKMNYLEVIYTKTTLLGLLEGKQIDNISNTDATPTLKAITGGANGVIKQTPYYVNAETSKDLSREIREVIGNMQFPSTKYNLACELTWTKSENLALITTPKTIAKLDVEVLADAFNLSKAELTANTILIDNLSNKVMQAKNKTETLDKSPAEVDTIIASNTLGNNGEILAVLIDKDLIQIWDTWQGAGTFDNPEGEYTNYFANREGIFATCTFANMAVFYKGTLPTI